MNARLLPCLTVAALLAGCAGNQATLQGANTVPVSDASTESGVSTQPKALGIVLDKHSQTAYEVVLNGFIQAAINGDTEQMVALTSVGTLKLTGLEKMDQIYSQQLVPQIQACTQLRPVGEVMPYPGGENDGKVTAVRYCTRAGQPDLKLTFNMINDTASPAVASVEVETVH